MAEWHRSIAELQGVDPLKTTRQLFRLPAGERIGTVRQFAHLPVRITFGRMKDFRQEIDATIICAGFTVDSQTSDILAVKVLDQRTCQRVAVGEVLMIPGTVLVSVRHLVVDDIPGLSVGLTVAKRWREAETAEQAGGVIQQTPKRYVAKRTTIGRFEYVVIYDTVKHGYPALLGSLQVPSSFPTEDEAQAWADEHLNNREG